MAELYTGNLAPAEIEFLAEDTPLTIVPNFSCDTLSLISGTFGPFESGMDVEVPLWLAMYLKKLQRCKIRPPEWMTPENLGEIKDAEEGSQFFTEMPSPYYWEVAHILLRNALEDVLYADQISVLLKDIFDRRMAKLRSSVDLFLKSDSIVAKINHLTKFEISQVRSFLIPALSHLNGLRKVA